MAHFLKCAVVVARNNRLKEKDRNTDEQKVSNRRMRQKDKKKKKHVDKLKCKAQLILSQSSHLKECYYCFFSH